MKCDGVCIPEQNLFHFECPLHKNKETSHIKAYLDRMRDLAGKRTSEGYMPKRGEIAQLRGD